MSLRAPEVDRRHSATRDVAHGGHRQTTETKETVTENKWTQIQTQDDSNGADEMKCDVSKINKVVPVLN